MSGLGQDPEETAIRPFQNHSSRSRTRVSHVACRGALIRGHNLSFIGPQHSANISNSPIPPYVAPGSAQNMHNRTVQRESKYAGKKYIKIR